MIAIVGSGPAGMAAAQQLARAGHAVTLYERDDRIGGLLRYGIPEFKMEKRMIDRRIHQMEAEGVTFVTKANIGVDIAIESLQQEFDAVILTGGACQRRDLPAEGRELSGIYQAMEYLPMQNHLCATISLTVPLPSSVPTCFTYKNDLFAMCRYIFNIKRMLEQVMD